MSRCLRLNIYELMAICIGNGVLDEEVCYHSSHIELIDVVEGSEEFFRLLRSSDPVAAHAGDEMRQLAHKWQERVSIERKKDVQEAAAQLKRARRR
jgi:hypothetical protein